MTQADLIALKPCPFCGGRASTIAGIVGCIDSCGYGIGSVEKWNTRTIERLSPPLDGEGVIQALRKCRDRFREYEASHRAKAELPALPSAPEALAKAERNREMAELCDAALSTISTPREDEVERVFHAIDACMSAFNGFENWRMQQGRAVPADEIITLDRVAERIAFAQKVVLAAPASLATLTPREQIRAEAFEEAAKVADRWTLPGDLDGDALRTIARQIEGITSSIRALSSLPAPSSREQRMEEALNRAFDFLGGIGGSSKIRDTILSALSLQDKT